MQKHSEIVILGSGLIGLSTALLLERYGLESIIIDKSSINEIKSTSDRRTTAISQGSARIYEKIGVWKELVKYSQPIYKIKVTEGSEANGLTFNHKMTKEGVMGYIIENKFIKKFLLDKVLKSKLIKIYSNKLVKSIKNLENKTLELKTQQGTTRCDLLIGADGRYSNTRKIGLFKYLYKNYNQNAYVFNIVHELPHKGMALERFFPTGPLAILPMKTTKGNQSSVVFTVDDDIKFKNGSSFNKFFKERYKDFFGKIIKVSKVSIFPLDVYSCLKYYKNNIVLVGDACQALHPIAGQGFNLGLRDCLYLSESLKKAKNLGQKVNSNLILKEYSRNRFYDKSLLVGSTHNLNKFFGLRGEIISKVRSVGLKLFNRSDFLKRRSMLFAMGITEF